LQEEAEVGWHSPARERPGVAQQQTKENVRGRRRFSAIASACRGQYAAAPGAKLRRLNLERPGLGSG
jgi:hypothetical protein